MWHSSWSTLTIKEDSKMGQKDTRKCPSRWNKKTGTRKSTKQDDGGEVDNSGDGMDVSFDCELNLFDKFEPYSL